MRECGKLRGPVRARLKYMKWKYHARVESNILKQESAIAMTANSRGMAVGSWLVCVSAICCLGIVRSSHTNHKCHIFQVELLEKLLKRNFQQNKRIEKGPKMSVVVTAAEQKRFAELFETLGPVGGKLTGVPLMSDAYFVGAAVRPFLQRSKLDAGTLASIWCGHCAL